jgi:hypothetical protein
VWFLDFWVWFLPPLEYVYELLNTCIQAIREQQTRIPYFSDEERRNIAENRQNDVLRNVLSANLTRCRENYRLLSVQFAKLLELIAPLIKQTRSLTHEVQLAVYLDWISYGTTLRQQKNKFKLSHESLIHCRRNVTTAIMNAVYPVYVQLIDSIPLNILTNHKFRHFVGAFGCIDGCLIPLQVQSDSSAAKWRCRKNFTAINGFFISDLENMSFSFALVGAEGSGPDSQVFTRAYSKINWPELGFLLADAGYALSMRVLTPSRGV